MAQQTINVGAAPNDGTGTPLRTAFQYTNSNFTELYTAVGPSGNNIVVPGTATITGALTLSAGTVNGVGYLNASKVLTAGSALVFDGTNLGIGGTGQLRFATSGGAIGDNSIGTENSFSMMLRCGRGSTSNIELASDKLVFSTSASERYRIASDGVATWSNVGGVAGTAMTLDSTGLGLGGSASGLERFVIFSGASKMMSIDTNGTFFADGGTGKGRVTIENSSATNSILSTTTLFGSYNILKTAASQHQWFIGSSTQAMTLDASGNLGIGVTPSAWAATFKPVQIGSGTVSSAFIGQTNSPVARIITNAYFDGTNFVKVQNNTAGMYVLSNNQHEWHNAVTGTGTAAFVQAMTLDASGNLLVGPTGVHLAAHSAFQNNASGQVTFRNTSTTAGRYFNIGMESGSSMIVFNDAGVGVYLGYGTTSWGSTSDEKVKDIIEPISNAVAKVGSLRSVIGKFKTDSEGTRRSFLIAQDVQSVLPEAVDTSNADLLAVRYTEVIPLLVAAIKELTARVQTLEAK